MSIIITANVVAGRGHFRYFQTEKYNLLKMIVFIQAILILFTRRPQKFKVTPKSVGADVYASEASALSGYLLIYAALTAIVIYGLLKVNSWSTAGIGVEALVVTLCWALYNAFTLLGGLSDVLSRPHQRALSISRRPKRSTRPGGVAAFLQTCSSAIFPLGGWPLGRPRNCPLDLPASISFYSTAGNLIRLPIIPARTRLGSQSSPA